MERYIKDEARFGRKMTWQELSTLHSTILWHAKSGATKAELRRLAARFERAVQEHMNDSKSFSKTHQLVKMHAQVKRACRKRRRHHRFGDETPLNATSQTDTAAATDTDTSTLPAPTAMPEHRNLFRRMEDRIEHHSEPQPPSGFGRSYGFGRWFGNSPVHSGARFGLGPIVPAGMQRSMRYGGPVARPMRYGGPVARPMRYGGPVARPRPMRYGGPMRFGAPMARPMRFGGCGCRF